MKQDTTGSAAVVERCHYPKVLYIMGSGKGRSKDFFQYIKNEYQIPAVVISAGQLDSRRERMWCQLECESWLKTYLGYLSPLSHF